MSQLFLIFEKIHFFILSDLILAGWFLPGLDATLGQAVQIKSFIQLGLQGWGLGTEWMGSYID